MLQHLLVFYTHYLVFSVFSVAHFILLPGRYSSLLIAPLRDLTEVVPHKGKTSQVSVRLGWSVLPVLPQHLVFQNKYWQ
jgi:uncharacterized SAM-binding protein YcdF (DUF218 family)